MMCGNTKVVRFMHALLSRLMNMFPTEPGKLASLPGLTQLSIACRRGLTLLQVVGNWAEPGKEGKRGGGEGGREKDMWKSILCCVSCLYIVQKYELNNFPIPFLQPPHQCPPSMKSWRCCMPVWQEWSVTDSLPLKRAPPSPPLSSSAHSWC